MKRRLLSATAALALLYGASCPAYAGLGFGDIVFDPTTYTEIAAEVKNGLTQIKWLTDLYGDSQRSLQVLSNFYRLFAHITNATQLAAVLNSEFLKSPMLAQALQLEQAFSGMGLHTTLAGKIQTIVKQMQYYTPSSQDFSGFAINRQATATAGQLASAQDAYNAASQRVTGLTQLMAGINTADPKAVLDLTARGTIETATAIAQGNQLQAAQLMQQANAAAAMEQNQQAYRFSVDQMRTQAQAAQAAANSGAVNLITR